jgi:hypothetical protein
VEGTDSIFPGFQISKAKSFFICFISSIIRLIPFNLTPLMLDVPTVEDIMHQGLDGTLGNVIIYGTLDGREVNFSIKGNHVCITETFPSL